MSDPTPAAGGLSEALQATCLVPVWDGPYRMICALGTNGACGKHGPHKPHPSDGRPCAPMGDGYCSTHGVYMEPDRAAAGGLSEAERLLSALRGVTWEGEPVATAVERIIASRTEVADRKVARVTAAVEALADEWERMAAPRADPWVIELRTALAAS